MMNQEEKDEVAEYFDFYHDLNCKLDHKME